METAAAQLAEVAERLADATATLDAAQVLATQLAERADAASRRAQGDVWIARLIVVLVCGALWLVAVTNARGPQSTSDAT